VSPFAIGRYGSPVVDKVGTVHMLHGYLCSGKTTVARGLETTTGGVRISLDEWMIGLTGDDVQFDDELYDRLFNLVTGFWPRLAAQGLDVVLDFGFGLGGRRDATRAAAESVGAPVHLYLVSAPDEVARGRCRDRIEGGYVLGEAGFDALWSKFEPLEPDEDHVVVSIQREVVGALPRATLPARKARTRDRAALRRRLQPKGGHAIGRPLHAVSRFSGRRSTTTLRSTVIIEKRLDPSEPYG
jgi:predicted kinase